MAEMAAAKFEGIVAIPRMEVRFIRKEDLEAFRTAQAGKPGYSGTSVQYGRSRTDIDEENQVNLGDLVKEATKKQSGLETEIKTLQKEVQELRQQLRREKSMDEEVLSFQQALSL